MMNRYSVGHARHFVGRANRSGAYDAVIVRAMPSGFKAHSPIQRDYEGMMSEQAM
jgi:hypothetical protein